MACGRLGGTARRYELTPKQFTLIEDSLPARGKRGGRWNGHRATLNGIFWWLYSGRPVARDT